MDETVFFASLFFFFSFFFCQKSCFSLFQFFLLAGSLISSRFFCSSKNHALAGGLVRISWSLVLLGCYWLFCRIAEEISADFVTCTVHVSLCQESQYGVHCTIVIGNLRILGVNCLRNKLGNAYFVDVGMCLENLIDFRHIAATTCKDDTTQQFIREFYRNLEPCIFYDFLYACFYDFDELLAFNHSILVDRVVECRIDIADIGISLGILEFHLFSIWLFNLKTS